MFEFIFDIQRFANIFNTNSNSLVSGTDDDDFIDNGGEKVTVNAGKGNDEIDNNNIYSVVNGGEGDDTINNYAENSTINGDAGNDNISNSREKVSINGGAGNDSISNGFGAKKVTISGGTGDDSINNSGVDGIYVYVGGNDTIDGYGAGASFIVIEKNYKWEYTQAGTNKDLATIYIINVLDDKNSIVGTITYWTYGSERRNIVSSLDEVPEINIISKAEDNLFIQGTSGIDYISYAGNSTVDAGAGNDYLSGGGNSYSSINCGAGDDSVTLWFGKRNTLDCGEGNDFVESWDDNLTFNGGKGDDSLFGAGKALILYANGDGNDYIEGFESSSRLSISGGTYSTQTSGNDLIITVGDGKITLAGAAGSNPNIIGEEEKVSNSWTLSGTTAKYGTSSNTLITVTGIKSLSGLTLDGTTVMVSASALNNSNVTISNGYTLAIADDVLTPKTTAAGWTLSGNIATYKNSSTSAGYSLDNNQIVYNAASGGENLITVTGVKSTKGLTLNGKTLTVGASALNKAKVTVSDGYTLAIGDDVTVPKTTAAGWTLSGNIATYKNTSTSAGYSVVQNQIVYNAASGGENLVSVNGVKSIDGLSINDKTVKIAASALNNSNVTISEGYTLAIAEDVPTPKTTAAGWSIGGNVATYKNASTSAGYSIVNNQIVYNAASGGETLITVNGVQSLDGISINGKTVKVAASALNNSNVTISNSYTLAIAEDVPTPKTTAAGWTLSGSTATYKNSSTSAGYSVVNNQIVYNAASGGATLITVNGVKSLDGITLDGTTVKVAALNQATVTISDGYTLAIAEDVPTPKTTAAGWTLSGSTATYKNSSTSAGYSVDNNQIVYNAASGGENLVSVNGVKSIDGISINDKTVKIAASALNNSNVTISNGYTLAIADDVLTPKTTAAGWTLSGNIATYKNTSTSAGYSVIQNQIVYNAASGGENLFTINGVKSIDGISINGTTVKVAASALNNSNVTISNGYTLAIANDVLTPQTTAASWTLNGNIATYKNASTSAGYSVVNNQIVYNAASGGETLITVSGVKSLDGISINGKTVTVSNSALNQATVTISNGYTLAADYDVPLSTSTEAGWTLNGSTATYNNSSTTAGYKVVDNQLVYNAASGGETLLTVNGVKSTKGLTLNGKTLTVGASALNKAKVTVSDGYTLAIADDVTVPKTTAAGWTLSGTTAIYKSASTTAGYKLLAGNQIVYNEAGGGKSLITISGVKSLDGIKLNGKTVKIAAAALNKSKVTLSGDGYKLALADDVTNPKTTKAWAFNKKSKSAIYTQTTTAGYTLAGNGKSVTYSKSATKNLITVSGVKSASGLSLKGKVVTLSKVALGTSKVTVTNGYKLALGSDVVKPKTTAAAWTLSGNTAIYKSASKKAGYTLAGNGKSVSYTEATTATTLATIKGAKSVKGLTVSGDKITLKNSSLSNKVTVSGDYEFDFAKDYKKATITGSKKADTLTVNGNNLSITGGAGNDVISLSSAAKNNVISYSNGDGNDIIYGFDSNDKLKIAKGKAVTSTSGNDVIFTVGKGKMTVKDGKDKKITYTDKSGEHTYSIANADVSINGSAIKLLPTYLKDTFDVANYGDTFQTIDGSAVLHALDIKGNKLINHIIGSEDDDYIDGGAGKDTILGGDGNDTLIGGAGNDSLKGGNGSDVFLYNNGDGDDVIIDYADEDKIKFASGTIKSVKKSGKDVVFTVGANKLTVKGASSKTVTYIDANGKTKYYPTTPSSSIIWTDSNTKAILRETYSKKNFIASDYNASIKTIDASAVTHGISIKGNGKANVILGGYDDDTINGSKGNDTLQGGTGKDVFVYANGDGKDIIVDYAEEDTIKITKGTAKITKNGDNVVFTVGSGKITVANAANKTVTYLDAGGNKKTYGSAPLFVEDDTDYELTPNLSSIVQSKAADCSFANTSTEIGKENNLITYSGSKK